MGKVTHLTGGEGGTDPHGLHLRQLPGEAAPPNLSIGQDLRAARVKRGDELRDVAHALRIRKDYLDALESDSPQSLPGRTYAIGFVRSYASYLGLDAPSMVTRYKLATAGMAEGAPQVGPAPEAGSFGFGATWILSGLAVAGLLVFGIYRFSEPRTLANAPAPIRSVLPHVAVRSLPAARKAQSPQEAPAVVGQVFGAQNHSARVVLRVRALTHVLVDGPGGRVYINRVLHPGDVYRVPNLVGLSLTTPNGGAVSLELDGRDVGAAGSVGRMIEALSLDAAAIAGRNNAGASGVADKVAQ